MQTYKEWLNLLKTKRDPDYWSNFVKHLPEISQQLTTHKQHVVARYLGLHASALSTLTPLIKEVSRHLDTLVDATSIPVDTSHQDTSMPVDTSHQDTSILDTSHQQDTSKA